MQKPLRLVIGTGLVLLATTFGAAAQDGSRIVAVNYPLQYFAERLLGDAGEAVYPVPEGTDPSFWRPSIAEISLIQSADLILLNGAGFAAWTDRVSLPRARLVDTSRGLEDQFLVTESITHSHGPGGEHSHEGTASYLWLDPELASHQAGAVAAAIKARGLAQEASVDAALEALQRELRELGAMAEASLTNAADTVLIATHPRYQYLAEAFGLTIVSLEWEAGRQPSEKDLEDLETLMAGTGASVLIWEAEPPAAARDAVVALGLTDVVFPTLAEPPAGGSFFGVFQDAVTALVEAVSEAGRG